MTKELVALNARVEVLSGEPVNKVQPKRPNTIVLGDKQRKQQALGSSTAKYAMVEFMDYQCPYCIRHAREVFPQLKRKFIDTNILQYTVRDFPLDFHHQAKPAAIAVECAAQQDAFWSMHSLLIENSRELNTVIYSSLAGELDLEPTAFRDCLQSKEAAQHVENEIAYANSIGVNGTPRVFIGKVEGESIVDVVALSGARPFSM